MLLILPQYVEIGEKVENGNCEKFSRFVRCSIKSSKGGKRYFILRQNPVQSVGQNENSPISPSTERKSDTASHDDESEWRFIRQLRAVAK
jgi:hypothetical protein